QQSRIKHIRPIRRRHQNDALRRVEPVHFDKQLIKRLFTFVIPAPESRAAQTANGVYFIDEDNAGSMFLSLLEQITHTRGPDSHEHLHEIRSADAEERHPGFSGNRFRQQRLARTRRPHDQHAFGDAPTEFLELPRFFQKLNDLLHFFFGFFNAGHIGERHLLPLFGGHSGAALHKRQGLVPSDLHLTHEEKPEAEEEKKRSPRDEEGHVPGAFIRRFDFDSDILLSQHFNEVGILRRVAPKERVISENPADMILFYDDFFEITLVELRHEIAEYDPVFQDVRRHGE